MDELGFSYEFRWNNQGVRFLAPPEYRELHQLGATPVIEGGSLLLSESSASVKYISQESKLNY